MLHSTALCFGCAALNRSQFWLCCTQPLSVLAKPLATALCFGCAALNRSMFWLCCTQPLSVLTKLHATAFCFGCAALRRSLFWLGHTQVLPILAMLHTSAVCMHNSFVLLVYRKLRKDCQMLLFSATYESSVLDFARKVIPNDPVVIRLRRDEQSLDNIKQYYVKCRDLDDKYHAICNVYSAISIGQSMIFCHVSDSRVSFRLTMSVG